MTTENRENISEALLIEKAKKGDEASFEALFLLCREKAYRLAFRYLEHPEDAMDAVQESFLKVYRGLNAFRGQSSFETWLYRIVANTCKDMMRKNLSRREKEWNDMADEEPEALLNRIPDSGPDPETRLLQKETADRLLACMGRLSEEHREVILLRDVQGMSYETIGEILDCAPGTVKSRIARARKNLKEIYLNGNKAAAFSV